MSVWFEDQLLPWEHGFSLGMIEKTLVEITASEILKFQQAWMKQFPRDDRLSLDITSVSSYSQNSIPDVSRGYNRDRENLPQINLLMLVSQRSRLPLWFEQLPGAIADITTIKDICENINGLWKGKKEPLVNVGVIRNANFTKDFKLDYTNIEYIDVEQRAFVQRHLLNGDLIVEKSGGSDNNPVGRAILYEGKNRVFSFSNFTMVLRVKDKNIVSSKFLYYYILYKYQKGFMRSMQTQTTGLHNLILDKYLAMPLYLPPYSEQQRIIKRIEVIFNTLDTIKESL